MRPDYITTTNSVGPAHYIETEREAEVSAEVGRLHQATHEVRALVDTLITKLTPVLRNEPGLAEPKSPQGSLKTELGATINDATQRTLRIGEDIRCALNRLEL